MKNIALLSSVKFPEFIREEYPALVKFIEVYYDFIESQSSIDDANELDSALTQYVQAHQETFAKGFGTPQFLDIRKFIMSNKEFFNRKGTSDAFIYLFKAFFGEEIDVKKPSFLQASGAVSGGYHYFFINRLAGILDVQDQLIVETNRGKFKLDIVKVATLSDTTVVAYFSIPRGFINQVGNKVEVINGEVIKFTGKIKRTPYRIVPLDAGINWQTGQVIQFPSVNGGKPLIARVSRVDENSGAEFIEIIQFGEPIKISAFSVSSLDSTSPDTLDYQEYDVVEQSPGVLYHTLNISDAIAYLGDEIIGYEVDFNPELYFLDDYIYDAYVGDTRISQNNDPLYQSTIANSSYSETTIIDSIGRFNILYGPLAKEPHFFITEDNLVSHPTTKIHDNLFYQEFAYSIETSQNINSYRGSLDLIHPAGHKFSAVLNKESSINTDIGIVTFNGWKNPSSPLTSVVTNGAI